MAITAKTTPTTSERCDIFFTTAGAVRSRWGVFAALIYVPQVASLPRIQWLGESHRSPAVRGTPAAPKEKPVLRARRPWLRFDSIAMREYRPRRSSGLAAESARRTAACL